MFERGVCNLTAKHTRYFILPLPATDFLYFYIYFPVSLSLRNLEVEISERSNLRQVSCTEHLMFVRDLLQFLPHAFCCPSPDPCIYLIKNENRQVVNIGEDIF